MLKATHILIGSRGRSKSRGTQKNRDEKQGYIFVAMIDRVPVRHLSKRSSVLKNIIGQNDVPNNLYSVERIL